MLSVPSEADQVRGAAHGGRLHRRAAAQAEVVQLPGGLLGRAGGHEIAVRCTFFISRDCVATVVPYHTCTSKLSSQLVSQ